MDEFDAGDGRLTPLRERQLIKAAQKASPTSCHALVEAYQDRLHAFVWRMVRNHHESEEVCQETFLRAFGAISSFNFDYRFSTWLFTIAYRLCLNQLRKRKDYSGEVDFDAMSVSPSQAREDNVGEHVAQSDEARRLKKVIWDSVEELTPSQRATVLLFYRESLSCQEIGEVLNMPAATVKSHLHRARNSLKQMLEAQQVEDWSVLRLAGSGGAA